MQPTKYDYLREQYPEFINSNHLYKICRISKRSASYLLQHGVIPCVYTGKKTRCYSIKLEDAILYMQKRDVAGTMIPPGAVSSCCKKPNMHRESYASLLSACDIDKVKEHFASLSAKYPEVLTVNDISMLTGLHKETIFRILKSGAMKSIADKPQYLIPKSYWLDFVTSPRFIDAQSNSKKFLDILAAIEK